MVKNNKNSNVNMVSVKQAETMQRNLKGFVIKPPVELIET